MIYSIMPTQVLLNWKALITLFSDLSDIYPINRIGFSLIPPYLWVYVAGWLFFKMSSYPVIFIFIYSSTFWLFKQTLLFWVVFNSEKINIFASWFIRVFNIIHFR